MSTDDTGVADHYRQVLQALTTAGVPYLVGGAYALSGHTGVARPTKDLDLFIRACHFDPVAGVLRACGHHVELTYPHWLGKARAGPADIDIIFNSGNGLTEVDDAWFRHARTAVVLGVPVQLVPVEEMIWSKAFVMERERYDGADVAHLLREHGAVLDWRRLAERMSPHWRVLLSHLVLFGFIYPSERALVPTWLMADLLERLQHEMRSPPPSTRLCCGTLLSREQYLRDVGYDGYRDARTTPLSSMSERDVARWTDAAVHRASDDAAGPA